MSAFGRFLLGSCLAGLAGLCGLFAQPNPNQAWERIAPIAPKSIQVKELILDGQDQPWVLWVAFPSHPWLVGDSPDEDPNLVRLSRLDPVEGWKRIANPPWGTLDGKNSWDLPENLVGTHSGCAWIHRESGEKFELWEIDTDSGWKKNPLPLFLPLQPARVKLVAGAGRGLVVTSSQHLGYATRGPKEEKVGRVYGHWAQVRNSDGVWGPHVRLDDGTKYPTGEILVTAIPGKGYLALWQEFWPICDPPASPWPYEGRVVWRYFDGAGWSTQGFLAGVRLHEFSGVHPFDPWAKFSKPQKDQVRVFLDGSSSSNSSFFMGWGKGAVLVAGGAGKAQSFRFIPGEGWLGPETIIAAHESVPELHRPIIFIPSLSVIHPDGGGVALVTRLETLGDPGSKHKKKSEFHAVHFHPEHGWSSSRLLEEDPEVREHLGGGLTQSGREVLMLGAHLKDCLWDPLRIDFLGADPEGMWKVRASFPYSNQRGFIKPRVTRDGRVWLAGVSVFPPPPTYKPPGFWKRLGHGLLYGFPKTTWQAPVVAVVNP